MVCALHRMGAQASNDRRSQVLKYWKGPQQFCLRFRASGAWESHMISEMQIHTIARQMIEKHGFEAIAQAARNAVACEGKGETEEAREWRHIEDAMKIMRGPHHS